jgi:uncharacterized membrane protein
MTTLLKLHRFLIDQLLYPLFLSTFLALGIFAGRVLASQSWDHRYLVWNLFLAWIPYLASFWAASLHGLYPGRWWILLLPGMLWLAFFPNAPYILTDFFHLRELPHVPLWYDVGLLAIFAWTGLFLAIASLRTMQSIVGTYLGRLASWAFVAVILALSGLGLYLGRFSRWNSWDLLLQPVNIFEDLSVRLLNPLDNLGFVGFTLMFTAILLVCYLMFISAHPSRESGER